MHITFNVELDSKTNKNGEKLIMIRATQNGNHKRINTGITIKPLYWDSKKKKAKKICPIADDINTTLNTNMNELIQLYLEKVRENRSVTLFEFYSYLSKPKATNFFQFAQTYKLKQFEAKNKLGTLRRYESVLSKLKAFTGAGLSLTAIDYTLLKEYETYLLDKKRNSIDTVSANMSCIRSIINEAIRHGFYEKRNPFQLFKLHYTDNTKLKLTIDELKRLQSCTLPTSQSVRLARDFFIACYYAAGCRAGDMITMKWENIQGSLLHYRQSKTGKQMIIPILSELQEIIDKYKADSPYIFPLIKSNEDVNELIINSRITYVNKYLKEVCKYAGIFKKITTHCARHSFADIALSLNNNDVYSLKDALGHSSVKTTEIYLRQRNSTRVYTFIKNIQSNLSATTEVSIINK